jgi:hypothetical protein
VARRFEEHREKFIKDMVETGNTVSSSMPLLLEKHVMDASWARGHQRLWCGPVVGLGDSLSRLILDVSKKTPRLERAGVFYWRRKPNENGVSDPPKPLICRGGTAPVKFSKKSSSNPLPRR